jgi:Methyltransferase domain
MQLPPPVPPLPAELLEGAMLLPDRGAILPLLPQGGTVAEVGVALGDFSRRLIDTTRPARFVAVDSFRLHELPEFWGRPPAEYFGGKTHGAWYRDRFAPEIDSGRMLVLEGDSAEQMEHLPDASVDILYIDADHTYPAVKRDLDVAVRKIKPDGWLAINDYVLVALLGEAEPYGVIYATNEFMLQHRWAIQYFALQTNMFCDVVLRRAELTQASPAAVKAENAALRREIAMLRNSTSWRLGAPMRAVGRLLGRA